jgi:hypothetical protein
MLKNIHCLVQNLMDVLLGETTDLCLFFRNSSSVERDFVHVTIHLAFCACPQVYPQQMLLPSLQVLCDTFKTEKRFAVTASSMVIQLKL